MQAEIIEVEGALTLRLPVGVDLPVGPVELIRSGTDWLILKNSHTGTAAEIFDILAGMPSDFYAEGRHDPPPEDVPSWDDV